MSTKISEQPAAIGAYAVMRHSDAQKRMHFAAIHRTYADAMTEAKRLYGALAESGQDPQRLGLYIVRVVGRVGVFSGALDLGGEEA